MEIATAAMGAVVRKLVDLLQEKYKLHQPLRQDIELLSEEMRVMQDCILNTSEIRKPSQYEFRVSELREACLDVEDILDEFEFHVQGKPRKKALGDQGTPLNSMVDRLIVKFKSMLAEIKARHKLYMQIQEIKPQLKQIQEIKPQSKSYTRKYKPIASVLAEGELEDATYLAPEADASRLVGVERPRDELISMLQLMEKEKDPESAATLVISIYGNGGLGKTTLARLVYGEIRSSFDCSAWVTLSRNPNMENVFMGILRQVEDPHNSKAADGNGERDLIRRIKKSLREKRYLMVLDDIWSTKTWEVIKSALPLDSCGNRVITTTRVLAAAKSCSSDWNGYIYQVIPLSSKDSWMLFRERIIGSTGSFPSNWESIGDKILERCHGVPLAIITMSSLLANKEDWEDVYKNISASPEGIGGMSNLILRSYSDLPQPLKLCFLYLSIFPEDYTIPKDHIIRCWIAEGFISDDQKRTAEEVGESYINYLKIRSMIEPICGSDEDGRTESFRIHSIILELIKYISVNHNFVTLINNEEPPSVLHSKIRRLSIINSNEDPDIPASSDISHVRSLHIFGGVGMKLATKNFSFLRVLDLDGCKDLKNHIIQEIPGLTSLRYLSIRDRPTSELPDQTGQQWKTIQMSGSCYLSRIPEWFRSLILLEYVCIDIVEVENKDLQLLSELPLLRYLSLSSKTVPNQMLAINSTGFPVLKELHLNSVRADLTFYPKAMPKLEILLLSLHVLPGIKCVPISIAQFSGLKKIDIRINGEGAAASHLFQATNVGVRKAADEHPRHPLVKIIALGNFNDHAVKKGKEQQQEKEVMEIH